MRTLFAIAITLVTFTSLFAQIDDNLRKDIIESGYLHSPLPLDYSKSLESAGLKKKVVATTMLCDMETINKWSHKGFGGVRLTDERSISGKRSLRLVGQTTNPTFLNWGIGLGTSMATYDVGGA